MTYLARKMVVVLGTIGKGVLEKAFVNSVRAIEPGTAWRERVTQPEPGLRIGEFNLST